MTRSTQESQPVASRNRSLESPLRGKAYGGFVEGRAERACTLQAPLRAAYPTNRLKPWRGIATRYEKTATIYLAGLHIAGIFLWSVVISSLRASRPALSAI